jgi:alpha-maltose-1-phosphate synthase
VPHEHVPRLLGEADIGLAPYSPDAPAYFSPLKLFEYLAAGLAIVAADIPGMRDATGSEAAVLIPPGDAPALAREVAVLAADHAARERLGSAARALAAEHTWQRRGQRIIEAVRELSEEPAAL